MRALPAPLLILGAAAVLSGCGSTAKPLAGTIRPGTTSAGHAQVDDPRAKHLTCLLQHGVPARSVGSTTIQIGALPAGPTVEFTPTPGSAQALQIDGQVQGAEVIGSALLYPHQASDDQLAPIESCLGIGVKG